MTEIRGVIERKIYYEVGCVNCDYFQTVYDCTSDEFRELLLTDGWGQRSFGGPWQCPKCRKFAEKYHSEETK